MEELTATTDISTCTVFVLWGGARVRADDLTGNQTVTIMEERVDGNYEPARDTRPGKTGDLILTAEQPSLIVEGYGNYKCLASEDGLAVGYAN